MGFLLSECELQAILLIHERSVTLFRNSVTDRRTVVLELITQWLKPLREFSAPSFTPQWESESATPLLALLGS